MFICRNHATHSCFVITSISSKHLKGRLKLTVRTTFLKIGNGKWERRSSSSPTCAWEEAQIPSSLRQRFNCVYIYVETMDENYVSHIGIFSLNKCPDLLNFYMNISLTFANGIRVSWPWWTCCCFGFL